MINLRLNSVFPKNLLDVLTALALAAGSLPSATAGGPDWLAKPGRFKSLTEPPCSYCSTQNRKGLVQANDRVLAWVRGVHNGGAIPLRHFLADPRVINDTYGLFFYDPDGGYVSAFKKDYGYEFYGWRGGVMVVKGRDGTLWSALNGLALEGPQRGHQLERLPALLTEWGYWLMLHPESTAYDLYDGHKYPLGELPASMSPEARQSLGEVDPRLRAEAMVLGVEVGRQTRAYSLDVPGERACFNDQVADEPLAVLWYQPTHTAVAYSRRLEGRVLTFYADSASPETAPIKDRETGTRWTLAGRGIDGPLRGKELTWVKSLQCKWYAWVRTYPETSIGGAGK